MDKEKQGSEWASNLPKDTELLFPCSLVQPGIAPKLMEPQNPLSFHHAKYSKYLLIVFTGGTFINMHKTTTHGLTTFISPYQGVHVSEGSGTA